MQAAFIRAHGDASAIEIGDMPEPEASAGEVIVRVRAASINRLDLYTRAGTRGTKQRDDKFPRILGGDSAGEIASVGDGVTNLQVGARVVINPLLTTDPTPQMIGTHRQGSYAEYVAVLSGAVTIVLGENSHSLSPGSYIVIPARMNPSWRGFATAVNLSSGRWKISANSGGTAILDRTHACLDSALTRRETNLRSPLLSTAKFGSSRQKQERPSGELKPLTSMRLHLLQTAATWLGAMRRTSR